MVRVIGPRLNLELSTANRPPEFSGQCGLLAKQIDEPFLPVHHRLSVNVEHVPEGDPRLVKTRLYEEQ